VVLYIISSKSRYFKNDSVVTGVYNGWDSFLLKYGGETLLYKRNISRVINIIVLKMWWYSIIRNLWLYLPVNFDKIYHNYFNQFLKYQFS